jgi:hemerythrin
MAIIWTEDLSTGVGGIDTQHKELFVRINNLLDACDQRKGKEEVGRFIRFLEEYVILHFAEEEKHMAAHGYQGLAAHKQEHAQFTEKLSALKQEFNESGAGIHVVLMAIRTSCDWLTSHIRRTDKAMGAFLKKKTAV